ncbi:MAG: hypothetical protein RR565_04210 [Erysipelothrix sp.]
MKYLLSTFRDKIAQCVLFSLVIMLVILGYLYNEIPKTIYVEEYTFLTYMSDILYGKCFPYILILLISMPMMLHFFSIEMVCTKFDYLIIQRTGIHNFYNQEKLKSFFRGFLLGIILNVFILFLIWAVHPSNKISLLSSLTNGTSKQSRNPFIEIGINILLQSIGIGIVNVGLFMLTRFRPNKYFFYLSLLLVTVAISTGVVVVFALITTVFPSFNNFIPFLIPIFSIFNPLSLLFPSYDLFLIPYSNLLKFIGSTIVYLVLIWWGSKKMIEYEKVGKI